MDIPAVVHPTLLDPNDNHDRLDPNNNPLPVGILSTVDDVENRPPRPPLDVISASSNDPNNHQDDPLTSMEVDIAGLEESNDMISQRLAPSSRFVPGPLREEPTLKEKLVDRERQRRKEAERARLKRQFALMSNGGGLVYDTVGAIGGASITGTVGEESTHADMEDSGLQIHTLNHHHQGGDSSPQQLGYTMERFLQETATSSVAAVANNDMISRDGGAFAVASAIASSTQNSNNNLIREEAIEGDPATAGAPDKGVVMERFLNGPVVVDPDPPPPPLEDHQVSSRTEDVHRSVSFDMELRTNHNDNDGSPRDRHHHHDTSDAIDDHLRLSIDDSNASVQVEVAPEDDMMEPVSPGGRLSVPSEVAPSSLETDEHHHHRQNSEMEASLGSVGPSIDRQSVSSNVNNTNDDDDDTDDEEPRDLRLTEAEIQEMAAIEEASIGNAPPSDRDEESLVGDLVGTFGTPNVGETNFSQDQDTTTTAMESGSILSGHPLSAHRSSAMPGDQPLSTRGEDMDDMDHNSIDDMAMSASVSSHLVVSPGASVSGSAASVTANPPSEIIGRGETTTVLEGDDDGNTPLPPPPSSVVVDSTSEMQALASPPGSVVDGDDDTDLAGPSSNNIANYAEGSGLRANAMGMTMVESRSSLALREELKASDGPPAEEIVNRRLRPGMGETMSPHVSRPGATISHVAFRGNPVDTPKSVRTVEEFDFDKNDLPMTPRSLMSDSLRDLPDDGQLWISPGSKMNVSPLIYRSGGGGIKYGGRAAGIHPGLGVPTLPRTQTDPVAESGEEGYQPTSDSIASMLESTFRHVRTNNSSTVKAKEVELYSMGSIQSKALETRLLPLVLTLIIEIPVLNMISRDSRLCSAIGQQHYQLLMGFMPLVAAISGNASAQASSLTTTAICHGQVTSKSYWKWIQEECRVTAIVGLGMGFAVGMLAFTVTSESMKENLTFAMAVGMAQWISLTLAGCTASNFPLLMCFLFRHNSRRMSSLVTRAFLDVISTSLTCAMSYCILMLFVSQVDVVNSSSETA